MVTPVLIQDLNPVYDMGTVRSTRDDVFLCGEVRAFRPQTAEKKGVVIFTDGSAHALDGAIETKIELGATYVFRVANTPHPENGYRVLETTPMKSCGETIKK
ncbi:MAG: hypothetical protein KBD55_02445 [Candidatus Pacebacteria bacterium]|nr:hypothetical protein [Candidatus Paceibacterota bacterium]